MKESYSVYNIEKRLNEYRIKGIETAFVKLYKEGKLEFSSKSLIRYSLDRII